MSRRHCEEQSDEAIQLPLPHHGLLRFARNDVLNSGATLSTVIVREGGRSSIPETLMIESKSRGVLDTPHARGMTAVFLRPH
jgi:hypothetical protein